MSFSKPSSRLQANGLRITLGRSENHWRECLENHVSVMHGGREQPTCPACKELRFRIADAKDRE